MQTTIQIADSPRCPASWSHSGRHTSWSLSCSLLPGHEERLHFDRDACREWAD